MHTKMRNSVKVKSKKSHQTTAVILSIIYEKMKLSKAIHIESGTSRGTTAGEGFQRRETDVTFHWHAI